MSFLLNTQDLSDKKISGLLMKNPKNNEAPLTYNNKSKLLDNSEIKSIINRTKKKKSTICPINCSLSSSIQSTLNTLNTISQKDNSKLNKFFRDISLTSSIKNTDSNDEKVQRLTRPKTDDMKFLYKVFFNYEPIPTLKLSSLEELTKDNNNTKKKKIWSKYVKKFYNK